MKTAATQRQYAGDPTESENPLWSAGGLPTLAVELAWCWLRYQPRSKLSLWYQQRFGHAGKRLGKIGIVALARKLLIAVSRYLGIGILDRAELRA